MKIGVIIVCYNSQKTIKRCLESIQKQSTLPDEVILVDGASTDNTLNIVNSFQSLISMKISEPDLGIYDAMNKGIKNLNADYFLFLNSDDYFSCETAIEYLRASILESQPDYIYCDIAYELDGVVKRIWKARVKDNALSHFKASRIPHPGFTVRTSLINNIGGFNLVYSLASDFDFILKVLKCKATGFYLERTLIHMEVGGASNKSIANIVTQNSELNQILKENQLSLVDRIMFFTHRVSFKMKQFLKAKYTRAFK
jgi:glycosyltransferase involved in cell wall biosynthesis